MNNLERRLEALEQEDQAKRMRFIWIKTGVSRCEALRAVGALATDEVPVLVGWQDAAEYPTEARSGRY